MLSQDTNVMMVVMQEAEEEEENEGNIEKMECEEDRKTILLPERRQYY